MKIRTERVAAILLIGMVGGCASPYHSDQGALFGGLLGAGTGAVVGHAVGNTAAGAVIGAGVGALGGAAIGNGMDESEARNRALIEQKLGRQVVPGAVSVPEVVSMARAGVNEEVIVNHVRVHGVATPLQANDLIYLQQQGVSNRVIETMQATQAQPMQAVQPGQPVAVYPAPPPVIVEERWGPPWHHGYYRPCPPPPAVSWGMTVRN